MKHSQVKIAIVLSYLTQGMNLLIGILYTPFMLRLLGQGEYGLYQLSVTTIGYLILFGFGINSSYMRIYTRYANKGAHTEIARLNSLFLLVMSAISFISILAGIILTRNINVLLGARIDAADISKMQVMMYILILNMAITFPDTVFECYITANERLIFHRLINLFTKILNPFFSIPLLLLGYGSVALVVVTTLLTIIKLIFHIGYACKKLKFQLCFHGLRMGVFKEIWIFSFFVFMNLVVDQINWNVDRLLLGRFSGTVAVAVYSVGAQFNTMFLQMSTAMASAFTPRINRMVAEKRPDWELTLLFVRVGRTQFLILSLALSGFLFFGKPFITLWAGPQYAQSYYIILLLLGAVFIPAIQNIGIDIQRAKNMHKVRSVIYLIMAMGNILISIPLIKIWGAVGAATGTFIMIVLGNGLLMNIYYHKKIKLDILYFWKQILQFTTALIPVVAVGILMHYTMPLQNKWFLMLGIILYSIVFGISMWFLGMNRDEKHMFSAPFIALCKRLGIIR